MVYRAKFSLSDYVKTFWDAYNYLIADDMTKYLIQDFPTLKSTVVRIEWILKEPDNGYILLVTNKELTTSELESLTEWVRGQNSDGIGAGFSDQRFAYYKNEKGRMVNCSFNWRTDGYKFEFIGE